MDPLELRFVVYRHFVETGRAPSRNELTEVVGDIHVVDLLLRELHDRHMLVLDDRDERRGEIRMALPFAAEPTDFRVVTETAAWWANCAWDALAILAAVHADGRITSTWADTGEPLELTVTDGKLDDRDGYVSFPLPGTPVVGRHRVHLRQHPVPSVEGKPARQRRHGNPRSDVATVATLVRRSTRPHLRRTIGRRGAADAQRGWAGVAVLAARALSANVRRLLEGAILSR